MSLEPVLFDQCRTVLTKGLDQLQIAYTDSQVESWLAYLALLHKWNRAYNLTSVRNPLDMVTRHLLDSLSVAPYIKAQRLIDVGTGPGLPGIPLAIAFPDKQFSLLDSNGKRTRFLQQVKVELKLSNINILQSRVEEHKPDNGYDGVLSRAFASLSDMIQWTSHLCHPDGCFMAMKGQFPDDEINQLPMGYKVAETHPLSLPGSDVERHLVIITTTAA